MRKKLQQKKGGSAAVGRRILAAGIVLCIALAGCDGADKALVIPAGEPVTKSAESGEVCGQQESSQQAEPPAGEICVHVCGAVNEPGVFRMPVGSRAWDALQAAGGFTVDAAEDAVNLAEPLKDGMQLYIPTGEEAQEIRRQRDAAESGLVDINAADEELLCTLPGIGKARAADIVAYREQNGGFASPEEIMQVPGIKEGAYAKIKDKITVR